MMGREEGASCGLVVRANRQASAYFAINFFFSLEQNYKHMLQ